MTTVNPGEYQPTIGLDSLYIAEVTADTSATYSAETPEYFAPAAQASQAPVTSQETVYADDTPMFVIGIEAETNLQLTVTGVPLAMAAKVLGKDFDVASGRMFDAAGSPPYVALGFRTLKSDQESYRYYWYLKGQFSVPNEEAAARAGNVDPKTTQLMFKAIRTMHLFDVGGTDKPVKRVVGDDDTTNFDATGWFSQVQTPATSAPDPLALSSSDPADGASGVAVDKTITLTFNNKLPADAIYNVVVVKADGTQVPCTNSLDATGKIMTVNPNSNLSGGSTYIVAIGVRDIYSQAVSAAVNFATV